MTIRVGVDVGGTFTDVFLYDSEQERFWIAKTPSTPQNQADGVITGIREICEKAGTSPDKVEVVLHGTTAATNALLEGKGARVGLITSYGWRNILHLADSWTPGPLFGFFSYVPPEPLVPHERIVALNERVTIDGENLFKLDDADIEAAINELLDQDIEALTVSLMHSYIHPENEVRVGAVAKRVLAGLGKTMPVSLSSEVSPEFREYERTVTTVLNSFLGPVMHRYLSKLEIALEALAGETDLQIVRSDGGLMSVRSAKENPVHTALSGPSGGVNGAAYVVKDAGYDRIITLDMGGTSTDIAVCIDGQPEITRETKVAEFPMRAPAINVETIGAGGGSIADVSEITGGLRVGPTSAGADPGPACYGRGGRLPTVTDANLIVGHLPQRLLGGEMTLDLDSSIEAFQGISKDLGVDVYRAAQAVIDIVNGNMLGALRVATVQKGLDPRDFALLSFGGAGGMHANALAKELGCLPVVVPPQAGVLSALGFVVGDVQNEFVRGSLCSLDTIDLRALKSDLGELETRARTWLAEESVALSDQSVRFVLDMRYHKQGYEIPVEFHSLGFDENALISSFEEEHFRLYGFKLPATVEIVTLRSRAIGKTDKLVIVAESLGSEDPSVAQVGTQKSWIEDALFDIPVYEREKMSPGMKIEGKALITQYDSTVVLLQGYVAFVDAWSNLVIKENS